LSTSFCGNNRSSPVFLDFALSSFFGHSLHLALAMHCIHLEFNSPNNLLDSEILWLYVIGLLLLVNRYKAVSNNRNNDLSLHTYSSKGEILQISYANAAVMKSDPILCFQSATCRAKVLIALHRRQSALSLPCKHNQCIQQFAGNTLQAMITGYPADRMAATKHLHRWIESYFHKFAEYPPVSIVANELGSWAVRGMYSSMQDEDRSLRPMAISAFLSSTLNLGQVKEDNNYFVRVDNAGGVTVEEEGCVGDLTPAWWSAVRAQLHLIERDASRSDSMLTQESRKQLILSMVNQIVESLPEEYEDMECAVVLDKIRSGKSTALYCPTVDKDQLLDKLKEQLEMITGSAVNANRE
jgi:20S proteasome alpha/beta subunit